jgi:hypothetical protein
VAEGAGWCGQLPPHLLGKRADPKEIVRARVLYVRAKEADEFMESVPALVAGLLNRGFSLDNPADKKRERF